MVNGGYLVGEWILLGTPVIWLLRLKVGVWLLDRGDIWGGVGMPSFVTNNTGLMTSFYGILPRQGCNNF